MKKRILYIGIATLGIFALLFFNNYQETKLAIVEVLDLSKDAIHIILGFLMFLAGIIFLKLKPNSCKALLPSLGLSLMMEMLDIRDDSIGGTAPQWLASIHDILFTNFIPIVLVITYRSKKLKLSYDVLAPATKISAH